MNTLASLRGSKFQLLLADPAWAFRTFNGRNRTPTQKQFREAEDHYATMSTDDMAALPVSDIVAKDALLAMWAVGSHLPDAHRLAAAWGFPTCVTDLFYWAKQKLVQADQIDLFTGDIPPPRMSMGYHTRKQVEPCLLFSRGKGLPVCAHDVRQLIVAPSLGHSRKPVEQYDRLERLYGDVKRIELFARNTRKGWESWGNEVGKFDEVAPQNRAKRIQLSRKKGWRMPEGARKVDRSTRWGNPYQAGTDGDGDRAKLVDLFRAYLERPEQAELVTAIQSELAATDLACWCPLDGPCHADVLLEVANR